MASQKAQPLLYVTDQKPTTLEEDENGIIVQQKLQGYSVSDEEECIPHYNFDEGPTLPMGVAQASGLSWLTMLTLLRLGVKDIDT